MPHMDTWWVCAAIVINVVGAAVLGLVLGVDLADFALRHGAHDFPQCPREAVALPNHDPLIDRSQCDPRDTKRYPKGCWMELDFLSPPSAPAPH